MAKRNRLHKTWVLMICVICVATPRFNRNQFFIKRPLADMEIHTSMVDYFRTGHINEILLSENSIAANWRPLFPLIASFLPFVPITSMSLLGILSISLSVLLLKLTMMRIGVRTKFIYNTLFLYIFSFPVFYYTTIGYVDPGLILMLTTGIYLIISEKYILFLACLGLGVFMKEGIIVLLPFFWLYIFYKKMPKLMNILWVSMSLFVCVFMSIITRVVSINVSSGYQLFWSTSTEMLIYNLNRMNSWMSFILVMGIPLLLLLKNQKILIKIIKKNMLVIPLISGIIMAVITYGFAFISTVADGRTLWATYPFIFLIIALIFEEKSFDI